MKPKLNGPTNFFVIKGPFTNKSPSNQTNLHKYWKKSLLKIYTITRVNSQASAMADVM